MFKQMKKSIVLGSLVIGVGMLVSEKVDAANASANQTTTEKQQTAQYHNKDGAIDRSLYVQTELEQLAKITHGTDYHGNTSLDKTATQEHAYLLGNTPISNFVGPDGVLQLFNQSTFMTDAMAKDAATYWNTLAGTKIVEIVSSQKESDEVIWDSTEATSALGGQTYDGQGIKIYVNTWAIDGLLPPEHAIDWKEAVLIHEIGHALGIPHLGGGADGYNAQNNKIQGTEFMASWTVGMVGSPQENLNGVKSTAVDAAALALAGLSWEKPQKLAKWVLTTPEAYVNYHNGTITSTIPTEFGIEIDFKGNYIQTKQAIAATMTIVENYNVYTVNDNILDAGIGAEPAKQVGTTASLGLVGKEVKAITYYTSTKGNPYYKVTVDGKDYVINSAAFKNAFIPNAFGIQIDFKENYIQTKKAVATTLTIDKNYNVYTMNDQILDAGVGAEQAKQVGTTASLGLVGKTVNAVTYYTSTKGNPYYKIVVDGKDYVINSAAFKK